MILETFTHQNNTFTNIEDTKIYYEEIGNPTGDAIIFLHGGLGNIEEFNGITPKLASQYRIIGIDSRGQGKSTLGNTGLSYHQMQLDVEVVLEELGIDEVIIIGFSDGGKVGYNLAVNSSLTINKLITIGSNWSKEDVLANKTIFSRVTAEYWKEKFPQSYDMYQNLNPKPDFSKLVENVVKMWTSDTSDNHLDQKMSTITCPTLLVRGDKDHLFSGTSIMKLSALLQNSSVLNIPFAGHLAFVDQQEIFNTALEQFL